jgi:hypothetical protein
LAAATIAAATVRAPRDRKSFETIEAYCMFIGYPRSGHSLVGSLLDAHPEIVIAHELDALKYLHTGLIGREQLFSLLLKKDKGFTEQGRLWTYGFDYSVPGQWQGHFTQLRVIGDKKGGATTRRLARDPMLLARLRSTVGMKIHAIHVMRNPFDNIASMHRRGSTTLKESRDAYFSLCAANEALRRDPSICVFDVRHEDLITEPKVVLTDLCAFLGLESTDAYLDACAAVVYPQPHRSRVDVDWPLGLRGEVQQAIDASSFLRGYAFDE